MGDPMLDVLAAPLWAAPFPRDSPADLVMLNGALYPLDPARRWASAVVVASDRILKVGDDSSARNVVPPSTRVVDLKHRMALPASQRLRVPPGMAPNPAATLGRAGAGHRDETWARDGAFAGPNGRCAGMGATSDKVGFLAGGLLDRGVRDRRLPVRRTGAQRAV
jgi:hypothetical protein